MARLEDNFEQEDFPMDDEFWGNADFNDEEEDEFEGSCIPKELFGLLGTSLINKNPVSVIFSEESDRKLLEYYGYKVKEIEIEGVLGKHSIAVKKDEEFPEIEYYDQLKPYLTKIVLDRLNQELMLKVMEWLIKKFYKG